MEAVQDLPRPHPAALDLSQSQSRAGLWVGVWGPGCSPEVPGGHGEIADKRWGSRWASISLLPAQASSRLFRAVWAQDGLSQDTFSS